MEQRNPEKIHFEDFLKTFEQACEKAGKKTSDVKLLPVSKGQDLEKLKNFLQFENFPHELAENYVEELRKKTPELSKVKWHFQGALQSRKMDEILRLADVIQSLSRVKEVELISKVTRDVKFFVQVNISSEGQKLGASGEELQKILEYVSKENLTSKLLGFMAVASELSDSVSEAVVRKQFAALREFRDKVWPKGKLSMGMSADFHLAIMEGSELVRVGSAIFGTRTKA